MVKIMIIWYIGYVIRYLVMFMLLKVFDILFFDWFLLCHSSFYPYFYPETRDLVVPHQFGFNKRSHVVQIIALIIVALLLAYIMTMFNYCVIEVVIRNPTVINYSKPVWENISL